MPPESDYGYKVPYQLDYSEWEELSYRIIYLTGRIAAIDQVKDQRWEALKNPIISQESSAYAIKEAYQHLKEGKVIKLEKIKPKREKQGRPRKEKPRMTAAEYQRRVNEVLG